MTIRAGVALAAITMAVLAVLSPPARATMLAAARGDTVQADRPDHGRPVRYDSVGVTCAMLPAGIRQQESGGLYGIQGAPVPSHGGARAQGAYQVMPAHLAGPGSWAREVLGRDVTPEEFRASPAMQDRLAGVKLRQLCAAHGVRGAAAAWFSGRPELHNDRRHRGGGAASVGAYVDNVVALSRRYG